MTNERFMDTREVCRMCSLSRQEIWRRRRNGSFPEPVRFGDRRVGYAASEIEAWMKARLDERDAATAARKEALK